MKPYQVVVMVLGLAAVAACLAGLTQATTPGQAIMWIFGLVVGYAAATEAANGSF